MDWLGSELGKIQPLGFQQPIILQALPNQLRILHYKKQVNQLFEWSWKSRVALQVNDLILLKLLEGDVQVESHDKVCAGTTSRFVRVERLSTQNQSNPMARLFQRGNWLSRPILRRTASEQTCRARDIAHKSKLSLVFVRGSTSLSCAHGLRSHKFRASRRRLSSFVSPSACILVVGTQCISCG